MTRATRPGQGIDRASTVIATVSLDEVCGAFERVIDPRIRRPITDLNMVDDVQVEDDGTVTVSILLTTTGCPLRDSISADVKNVIGELEGVERVFVKMGAINSEQRAELQAKPRGSAADRVVPFAQKDGLTRVLAVTSRKNGVGKSSVTVNLAAAMAASGFKVGLVDADIFGFSVPRMMGVDQPPIALDGMIIPPVAHDVKVISIGMFLPDNSFIPWRGSRLHHALEQFFSDVFWGDLDVLLFDLPPGTGDIAISVVQLIPNSEAIVVTMPQVAVTEVVERVGQMVGQTNQRAVGVIENMSYLVIPDGSKNEIFGHGGGATAAEQLTADLDYEAPLLGNVPIEVSLCEGGDEGASVVLVESSSEAQESLCEIAGSLARRARGLAGLSLSVTPVR